MLGRISPSQILLNSFVSPDGKILGQHNPEKSFFLNSQSSGGKNARTNKPVSDTFKQLRLSGRENARTYKPVSRVFCFSEKLQRSVVRSKLDIHADRRTIQFQSCPAFIFRFFTARRATFSFTSVVLLLIYKAAHTSSFLSRR